DQQARVVGAREARSSGVRAQLCEEGRDLGLDLLGGNGWARAVGGHEISFPWSRGSKCAREGGEANAAGISSFFSGAAAPLAPEKRLRRRPLPPPGPGFAITSLVNPLKGRGTETRTMLVLGRSRSMSKMPGDLTDQNWQPGNKFSPLS